MRKSPFKVRFQMASKKSAPRTGIARKWADMSQVFVAVWDTDLFV